MNFIWVALSRSHSQPRPMKVESIDRKINNCLGKEFCYIAPINCEMLPRRISEFGKPSKKKTRHLRRVEVEMLE